MKAVFRMKSPIKPVKTDLTGVDTLVIASPVWAGKVPAYVNTYLDSVTGGSGKPFHVIVEMGGRGDQSAIAVVRKALEQKGMKFVSSISTIEKDVDSGSFAGIIEKFVPASGKNNPGPDQVSGDFGQQVLAEHRFRLDDFEYMEKQPEIRSHSQIPKNIAPSNKKNNRIK